MPGIKLYATHNEKEAKELQEVVGPKHLVGFPDPLPNPGWARFCADMAKSHESKVLDIRTIPSGTVIFEGEA